MADGPVSYWRLEDTDNLARNEIAGGPTGTFMGDVDRGVDGAVPGRAARFDGLTTRLEIGNVYDFGGDQYSAEAWLISEDNIDTRFLFSRLDDAETNGWQVYYGVDYLLHSRNYGGVERDYSNSGATPPTGWVHVVATFDGTQSHIYVNGEAFDSNFNIGTLPASSDGILVIGDSAHGQFNKINGVVDEIAIYDRALTPVEVQAHYAASGR